MSQNTASSTTATTTTTPPTTPIPSSPTPANLSILTTVNKSEFGEFKGKQGATSKQTFAIITAVLIVMVVAVIGFLIDAWRFHSQTLEQYKQALQQNSREKANSDSILVLKEEIERLKFAILAIKKQDTLSP